VIRSKTAKLFEAAGQIGALIAGADEAGIEAAGEYGRSIGTAFQLIDDVLDYSATAPRSARTSATTCAKASPPCR
jgi:octaprenyl-diphosphate synthase